MTLHVRGTAVLVRDEPAVVADPDRVPVGRDEAVVGREPILDLGLAEHRGLILHHRLAIVGVEDRLEESVLEPALDQVAGQGTTCGLM